MRVRVIAAAVAGPVGRPCLRPVDRCHRSADADPPMVMCTDLPVTSKPVPRAHRSPDLMSPTAVRPIDRGACVINRTPDDGLAVGQRYIAQRLRTDAKRLPRPGEGYGDLRVTGWVTVRAIDEINALAQIDFACDSIEIGDFLEPYVEPPLPTDGHRRRSSRTSPIAPTSCSASTTA